MNKHVSCEYACLHFGSFSLQYCQTLTRLTVKGLLTVQYEHACMVLMYLKLRWSTKITCKAVFDKALLEGGEGGGGCTHVCSLNLK